MGIDMHWHIEGKLMIYSMYPENGGSLTLCDDTNAQIDLFTRHREWWSLYCVLPKHPDFKVYRHGHDTAIRDRNEANDFLLSLLPKFKKEAA